MNKLTQATESNLSPALSNDEREMILAKEGVKIKDLNKPELKKFLMVLISKTHLECGQTQDVNAIKLTIDDLVNDLISYAGGFTLPQITHSFKLGAMQTFGEYFGLNNNTFRQWVRNYMCYSKRYEANKKQEAYLKSLKEPKQLTKEENDNLMKDASLSAFEIFKDKKYYPDYGNATFNFLWRKRIISFSPERIQSFKNQAKKEAIELSKKELSNIKSLEVGREIKKELTEIESGAKEDVIVTAAKKIALNTFFKELVETETELKDLYDGA